MPRASMATLITRTRRLVGDPAGGSQVFTDDEIQDVLDERRIDARQAALIAQPTDSSPGTSYLDWYAPVRDWEADEVLQDVTFATLTPASSDRIGGRWTLSATKFPVTITGKSYDLHGAAAELLEQWAAKVKLEFDFKTDYQEFDRSQKVEAMLGLAASHRRRARSGGIRVVTGPSPAW